MIMFVKFKAYFWKIEVKLNVYQIPIDQEKRKRKVLLLYKIWRESVVCPPHFYVCLTLIQTDLTFINHPSTSHHSTNLHMYMMSSFQTGYFTFMKTF